MQLVSVLRHELPAVLDFRGWLVLGTLGERIDLDQLGSGGPSARVVQRIQLAIDLPVSQTVPKTLIVPPRVITVASRGPGRIG